MPTPRHQLDACGRWAGDVGRPPGCYGPCAPHDSLYLAGREGVTLLAGRASCCITCLETGLSADESRKESGSGRCLGFGLRGPAALASLAAWKDGAPTLSPPSCWSRGAWTVGARHEQRLDLLGALAWHASRLPRLLGTRCGAPRACSHRDGGGPRRPIEGMGGPPRDWWHDRLATFLPARPS